MLLRVREPAPKVKETFFRAQVGEERRAWSYIPRVQRNDTRMLVAIGLVPGAMALRFQRASRVRRTSRSTKPGGTPILRTMVTRLSVTESSQIASQPSGVDQSSQVAKPSYVEPNDSQQNEPASSTAVMNQYQFVFLSCAIGLTTGILVVTLSTCTHAGEALLTQIGSALDVGPVWGPFRWAPLAGGLLVTATYAAMGGQARVQGTTLPVIKNLALSGRDDKRSHVTRAQRAQRALARAGLAAVTLGSGCSLGPEGPSVELGANVASFLSDFGGNWPAVRESKEFRLSLLATGCAAGVAAGFNAPIAGLFFAVEVINPINRKEDTVARLLATTFAATVVQVVLGGSPAVGNIDFTETPYIELPVFMLLGSLCGVASAFFIRTKELASSAFGVLRNFGVSRTFHPLLASILVALFAGVGGFDEVLYQGYDNLNGVLLSAQNFDPTRLALLTIFKIVLTAICIGSGLVGGIFAPALYIGACGGALYGQVAGSLIGPLNWMAISPSTDYAAVGAAATLAAICDVPVTAVVLMLELTAGRDYAISLPLIAAVSLAVLIDAFFEGRLTGMGLKTISRDALVRVSMPNDADELFQLLDVNKDGTLSKKEFIDGLARLDGRRKDSARSETGSEKD